MPSARRAKPCWKEALRIAKLYAVPVLQRDDGIMSGRTAKWVGGVLAAGAGLGMGAYFIAVGLDRADKLASVAGAFIGLGGLVLALYGVARERQQDVPPEQLQPAEPTREATHNQIQGGTYYGPVIQGRDIGPVNIGSPPPKDAPQDSSCTPAAE